MQKTPRHFPTTTTTGTEPRNKSQVNNLNLPILCFKVQFYRLSQSRPSAQLRALRNGKIQYDPLIPRQALQFGRWLISVRCLGNCEVHVKMNFAAKPPSFTKRGRRRRRTSDFAKVVSISGIWIRKIDHRAGNGLCISHLPSHIYRSDKYLPDVSVSYLPKCW
jgi:hypothetical protein